ncbi:MAG TPA: hypothetical protein VFO61_03880, partial [Alphaproteobacteria bacterium]|nr:hypothetical protein [Alphaproteobacteria bacterium]
MPLQMQTPGIGQHRFGGAIGERYTRLCVGEDDAMFESVKRLAGQVALRAKIPNPLVDLERPSQMRH